MENIKGSNSSEIKPEAGDNYLKHRFPPNVVQKTLLGLMLLLLGTTLSFFFLKLWPAGLEVNAKGSDMHSIKLWSNSSFDLNLDVQLILLVMMAGGIGSFIHTATSFADYVGNETLSKSWSWWYILRPFIGMALAAIFYLVIRGGFLSAGTAAGSVNSYGIAALAGLVGMFAKQATDKLDEVFNTLFRTAPGGGDGKRKDDLKNSIPSISDLEPKSIETPTENLIVKIKGTGFVKGAVVRVNGTNRDTEYIEETTLRATLLKEDVERTGELEVRVFNPPPGGGESVAMKLKIAPKDI